MLTVQMTIGSVEADLKNGNSQRRYQGYTTGAQRSDAAIGQANTSGDRADEELLSHVAARNPTNTGTPAAICGRTPSSLVNRGSLNRKLCTYVTSEPIGMRVWLRRGTYRSPTTASARAASRLRTRFQ